MVEVAANMWRCPAGTGDAHDEHAVEVRRDDARPAPWGDQAMRLDASRADSDAELAEWRALLDGAKRRRAPWGA